uniref:Uncharacterized protein n=1 Tax=Ditylenchus dipsaci TaxID=166011 RepID=A0A915E452_9BILA
MILEVVKNLFSGDPGGLADSFKNYKERFLKRFGCSYSAPSEKSPSKTIIDASNSQDKLKHIVHFMSEKEFLQPIQDEYAKSLSQLPPEEIYDNYNPGPTKPDGSVNFECHCVAHLVGSPCGYYFRKAITCQKSSSDEEMEKEHTQCFRLRDDKDNSDAKPGE